MFSLFIPVIIFKRVGKFLGCRTEDAQIAANGDEGRAPFQIAARIGFHWRQNAAWLTVLLRAGEDMLDSALHLRMGGIAQMA